VASGIIDQAADGHWPLAGDMAKSRWDHQVRYKFDPVPGFES